MTHLRQAVDLIFGPDDYMPTGPLWGFISGAIVSAIVLGLLHEDDY